MSYIIAIHAEQSGFEERWSAEIQKRGSAVKWVDLKKPDALKQIRDCDGVMWRRTLSFTNVQSSKRILQAIEFGLNIPVFPDYRSSWHDDDKVAQHYLLQAARIPTPRTWVFWSTDPALEWASKTDYPVVFKLASGASSSNVILIKSEKETREFIKRMFSYGLSENHDISSILHDRKESIFRRFLQLPKCLVRETKHQLERGSKHLFEPRVPLSSKLEKGYVLFQEFIKENLFDTRITVIGKRAFGFRRHNRPGDFRASGSGRIDYDPSQIDRRLIHLAFDISKRLGFNCMAYDFLMKNGKPAVIEMNCHFLDSAVRDCEGHWTTQLEWVPGHLWPEEAQVEDFMGRIKNRKRRRK